MMEQDVKRYIELLREKMNANERDSFAWCEVDSQQGVWPIKTISLWFKPCVQQTERIMSRLQELREVVRDGSLQLRIDPRDALQLSLSRKSMGAHAKFHSVFQVETERRRENAGTVLQWSRRQVIPIFGVLVGSTCQAGMGASS